MSIVAENKCEYVLLILETHAWPAIQNNKSSRVVLSLVHAVHAWYIFVIRSENNCKNKS